MSIQSEITRISGNVQASLAAVEEKGVTVPEGSGSDELAGLIAEIQEAVQPDWNQNDSTQPDYIKNRPFYEYTDETETKVVKIDNKFMPYNKDGENFAAGDEAGNSMSEAGLNNTAVGNHAMTNNTTGSRNTAVGSKVMINNTTGSNNSAVGCGTMEGNVSGSYNTAIGEGSLACNKSGSANTAIGRNALWTSNTNNNTAVGCEAMQSTVGFGNVAVGTYSMKSLVNGTYNVAVGYSSNNNSSERSYSISIGCGSYANYNESTAIGHDANVTGTNQFQLGNSNAIPYAYQALQIRSDARDKLDIQDEELGLDFVMALRPRKYRLNPRERYADENGVVDYQASNDGSKAGVRYHSGFVAQEVKAAMDALGIADFTGYQDHKITGGEDVLSLGYESFIPVLVNAIQEQQKQINTLKQMLNL